MDEEGNGKGTHQACDGQVGALDVRASHAFFGDAVRERGLQGSELGRGHGVSGCEREGGGTGSVVPRVEEGLVEVAEEGYEVQEAGDDGCVGVRRRGGGERDRAAQGQGTVPLQGVGALGDDEQPEGAAAEERRARGHGEVGFFLVEAQGFQQGDGFAEVEPGGVVAVAVEEAGEDEEARVHILERGLFDVVPCCPGTLGFVNEEIRGESGFARVGGGDALLVGADLGENGGTERGYQSVFLGAVEEGGEGGVEVVLVENWR